MGFVLWVWSLLPAVGALCTTVDKDFDGLRYREKIAHCRRHVTSAMKVKVMKLDHVARAECMEVDHFIPLSLGGSNALRNLGCQGVLQAAQKDVLENHLYHMLLVGMITQANAIRRIQEGW